MPIYNKLFTRNALIPLNPTELINIIIDIQKNIMSPANPRHTKTGLSYWTKNLLITEILAIQLAPRSFKYIGNTSTIRMIDYLSQQNKDYSKTITRLGKLHEQQISNLNEDIRHHSTLCKEHKKIISLLVTNNEIKYHNLSTKNEELIQSNEKLTERIEKMKYEIGTITKEIKDITKYLSERKEPPKEEKVMMDKATQLSYSKPIVKEKIERIEKKIKEINNEWCWIDDP